MRALSSGSCFRPRIGVKILVRKLALSSYSKSKRNDDEQTRCASYSSRCVRSLHPRPPRRYSLFDLCGRSGASAPRWASPTLAHRGQVHRVVSRARASDARAPACEEVGTTRSDSDSSPDHSASLVAEARRCAPLRRSAHAASLLGGFLRWPCAALCRDHLSCSSAEGVWRNGIRWLRDGSVRVLAHAPSPPCVIASAAIAALDARRPSHPPASHAQRRGRSRPLATPRRSLARAP